ncbi:MAG: hypothetical protein ABR936_16230 [Bacteroidota bacterium]
MNLTKHFLFLFILLVVCVLGLSGCYTQLATSSDNPELVNNSPTVVIDQPPSATVIITEPMIDPIPEQYYPHLWNPPPPAGSTSTVTGTDSPPESPHRQSGYERSPSTDQSNSHQTDATPSRTSWSPALTPTPNVPTQGSESGARTSGSTRKGR